MDKKQIIHQLQQNHQRFTEYMDTLNEPDFMFSLNNEKWTAGQQLDHIHLAVKPLGEGIVLPKFVVGMVFGKSNRPSRSFEGVVERYHEKLANGGKASKNFVPKPVEFSQRQDIKNKLNAKLSKLCKHLNKYTEEELDKHILPHPLLGKITLREMMYFTIYHVEHHHKMTMQNLAARN